MADGVAIKVETAQAVKAQENLSTATKSTFSAIEDQAKKVAALEAAMRTLGASTEAAAASQRSFPPVAPVTGGRTDAGSKPKDDLTGIRAAEAALRSEAKQRSDQLARSYEKEAASARGLAVAATGAGRATRNVGQQAGAATSIISRLVAVSGNTGATRSFGVLATASRALLTSLNPLGVATALVVGGLIGLASNAIAAETPVERLQSQAKEAQKNFSLLDDAVARTNSNLSALAATQAKARPFGDIEGAYDSLVQLQEKLRETKQDLNLDLSRTNDFDLNIEQIKKLGEAIGFTAKDFQNLEGAAKAAGAAQNRQTGADLQKFLKALEEAGVVLKQTKQQYAGGLLQDNFITLTLSATEALRLLSEEQQETAKSLAFVRKEAGDSLSAYAALAEQTEEERKQAKLGNEERKVAVALARIAKEQIVPLSEAQREFAESTLAAARAADVQAAAEEERTKTLREAQSLAETRERQQKAEAEALAKRRSEFNASVADLQKETRLLHEQGDERERLALTFDLQAKAEAAQLPLDEKRRGIIENTVDALIRQRQADEDRTEALRDAAQEHQRAIENDKRRLEIIEQLQEDQQTLLAVTDEEYRAKVKLARLNDILRQTETDRGSAAAKAIEAELDKVEKATRFQESLANIRSLGEETFGAIGQNIVRAASSGSSFRQFLQGVAQDLLAIASQRFIIDSLAKLGGQVAASFFTQSSATPTGGGGFTPGAGFDPYNFARGGYLPSGSGPTTFAARGVVLDRLQSFNYNGKRITTNEGGAATPEAVVPLERDKYGRLGIIQSGGGASINISFPNVQSAREARKLRPTMRQTLGELERGGGRFSGGLRGGRSRGSI